MRKSQSLFAGGQKPEEIEIGSMIYAVQAGDGSAREQAASCQRVLGGLANICSEYATKRYRSNVMNWGMVPFQMEGEAGVRGQATISSFPERPKGAFDGDMQEIPAYVIGQGKNRRLSLYIAGMTDHEKEIVEAGSLIKLQPFPCKIIVRHPLFRGASGGRSPKKHPDKAADTCSPKGGRPDLPRECKYN
jgi:aconitase A